MLENVRNYNTIHRFSTTLHMQRYQKDPFWPTLHQGVKSVFTEVKRRRNYNTIHRFSYAVLYTEALPRADEQHEQHPEARVPRASSRGLAFLVFPCSLSVCTAL